MTAAELRAEIKRRLAADEYEDISALLVALWRAEAAEQG